MKAEIIIEKIIIIPKLGANTTDLKIYGVSSRQKIYCQYNTT